jgi:chromosome segregation ATPase
MSSVDPRPDLDSAPSDGAAAIAVRVAAVREYLDEVRGERDRAVAQWLSAQDALEAERQALRRANEELEELRIEALHGRDLHRELMAAQESVTAAKQSLTAMKQSLEAALEDAEAQRRLATERGRQLEQARVAASELEGRLAVREADAARVAADLERQLRSEREAHGATRAELYRSRREAVNQQRLEQEAHAATRAELARVSDRLALRSSQLEAIRAGRAYRVMRRIWRIRARVRHPLGAPKPPKQLPRGDSGG